MEYKIPVNKDNIYKAILILINRPFELNLSDLELDILATWLKHKIYVIDTDARDLIRKVLDKGKFNTNNYIKRLKAKNIIILAEDSKKLYLNPKLASMVNSDTITFKFDLTN